MARPRKKDTHLPRSVYLRHNAYYFVDHVGKWHRLGQNLGEMYRKLADFVDDAPLTTMDALFDRYLRDVVPQKSPATQKLNRAQILCLRKVFGGMHPTDVTAPHICSFRDKRGAKTPTSANRELEVLAHTFRYAVEWGAISHNPCREVRKLRLLKRNRYVQDWEFQAVYEIASPRMKVAMDLALLTGLRRGDLLSLTRDDLTEDGILVTPSKTETSSGKTLLIEWSEDLREVVGRAKCIKPQVRQHLICNRQGKAYTPHGFTGMWKKLIERALEKTHLTESFRFNDLRAKSASDDTLEAASERLGHTNLRTTQDFYRRKPSRVKPLARR